MFIRENKLASRLLGLADRPSLGDISLCPTPGCPQNKSDFFSLNPLTTKFCHSNLPRYILTYLGGRLSCLSIPIREIKRPLAGRPMTLGPRWGTFLIDHLLTPLE